MAAKEWGLDWKGRRWRGLVWQPQGEVKGVVSTVHGLVNTSAAMIMWLSTSSRLMGMLGVDLLGHGRSPWRTGTCGEVRTYHGANRYVAVPCL